MSNWFGCWRARAARSLLLLHLLPLALQVGPLLMDLAPSGLTTILDRLRCGYAACNCNHHLGGGSPIAVVVKLQQRAAQALSSLAASASCTCLRYRCHPSRAYTAYGNVAACHTSRNMCIPSEGCRRGTAEGSVHVPAVLVRCCNCESSPWFARPFLRCRTIIAEGDVDVRTQYLVEGLFSLRKAGFEG